jgi:hypothetical protein
MRPNRRTSDSRGLLFYRLLEQAVVTEPVTYEQIVAQDNSTLAILGAWRRAESAPGGGDGLA